MSYGNVRDVGVVEAYYVDPDCPDDMYMTPDSKFWASCAGQKSKANFIQTIVAITIILIILLTILLFAGATTLFLGIALFIGLAIIGYSAFNMVTAERRAETMHREAMMSLSTSWGMDYNTSFVEDKNGRQVWKPDALEKFTKIRAERRAEKVAEKDVATRISVNGGPGGSAAPPPPPTFGSEVGAGVGAALRESIKGFFSRSEKNPDSPV